MKPGWWQVDNQSESKLSVAFRRIGEVVSVAPPKYIVLHPPCCARSHFKKIQKRFAEFLLTDDCRNRTAAGTPATGA
jgi:hypothetical protein